MNMGAKTSNFKKICVYYSALVLCYNYDKDTPKVMVECEKFYVVVG